MATTVERPADDPTAELPYADEDRERFRPTAGGWAARAAVVLALAGLVVWYVLANKPFRSDELSAGVILAIGALSLNVLVGYTGQISLGHQAFIGIGAFSAAYVFGHNHQGFYVGLLAGAAVGAVQAVVLGLIALRVRGLYFALVTLAWGFVAENAIFRIVSFTGGGAGAKAPRPSGFESDKTYLIMCAMVLALILLVDWRLVASKAGRALQAIRESPNVASSFGVNVRAYTLFAFAVAGVYAGVAGSLFAARRGSVVAVDFTFADVALPYLIVTVVGGLRRRGGIVVFALLYVLGREYLPDWGASISFLKDNAIYVIPALSGVLAIFTLIFQPDGVGTFTAPIGRWLKGERFGLHARGGVVTEGVDARP
jgi:branched-chain amino acid transport system permease protein